MSVLRCTVAGPEIAKAVIPAAGLGTRLRPLTQAVPKELLPIGRHPVLAHVAAELRGAGVTRALFIVSERKPQIRAFFGDLYAGDDGDLPALQCDYVNQAQQHGLGDALLYAQDWVDDAPFVVAFGDCLIDAPDPSEPLRRMIGVHRDRRAAATVLAEVVAPEIVSRYGVLAPERPFEMPPTEPFAAADVVEKPSMAQAPSNLAVAARWVLGPEIFSFLRAAAPDGRGELNLTDAVRAWRRAGGPLWAVPMRPGETRCDIGNYETFFTAFVRAALRDGEYGAAVRRAIEAEFE